MSLLSRKLEHLGFKNQVDFETAIAGGEAFIDVWLSNEPQPTQAAIDAVTEQQANSAKENRQIRKSFEVNKRDKALIKWIANLHGLSNAQARNQLRQIWRNLP